MQLRDIMNRNVKTIGSRASIEDARSLMERFDIRHLVVIEGGRVTGVVSNRDVGGRRRREPRGETVADVMTPHVVTAEPTTSVKQAANLLRGHVIGLLPVMENGRLKGVISTSDLLELIGRGSERPVQRVERPTLRRKAGFDQTRALPVAR